MLVRRRVSGTTSAKNVSPSTSTTVRQTPLTAMLPPTSSREASSERTARCPVRHSTTCPTVSTMPVNMPVKCGGFADSPSARAMPYRWEKRGLRPVFELIFPSSRTPAPDAERSAEGAPNVPEERGVLEGGTKPPLALVPAADLLEAVLAVHRASLRGQERHLRQSAAHGALDLVHGARPGHASALSPQRAAFRAASGLVHQS